MLRLPEAARLHTLSEVHCRGCATVYNRDQLAARPVLQPENIYMMHHCALMLHVCHKVVWVVL